MQKSYREIGASIRSRREEVQNLWRQTVEREASLVAAIFGATDFGALLSGTLDDLCAFLEEGGDVKSAQYERLLGRLERLSTEATINSVSPTQAALFVFALKNSIQETLQQTFAGVELTDAILLVNAVVDQLGLYTFETYVRSRESVIKEQQKAILEVSVPVVRVWNKILLLPLIGMIDSSRTQMMMETLLSAIEETQSKVAILDISGIPIVDSLVARHLILTASAARLMGAECIITGISSRISQTMVNLGVDLTGIVTRSSLADGLELALDLTGQKFA